MMPPKKSRYDWSWVGDISDPTEITDEHRLQAAGLTDLTPCTYVYPTCDPDIVPVKDKGCNKKKCQTNPRCLNYVGIARLLEPEPKGKEKYIEEKWDKPVQRADGIPAGLRNLGATCYANAFLQLWYHNVAFRNGIYGCEPKPKSPLYHLAHIFGSLQYTQRPFIDPMALIESLRLNKGEQQDAAEFSKLFLDMIASELSKQKDESIRDLTRNMFQGTIQYTTTCDCGLASHRESSFLELELSLKEGTSLADRLEYSLRAERLEGDNQYYCQTCQIKRDATRSSRITAFPPVLHFSLLRFVFDAKTYERRKSRASIKFPRTMDLGGHHYRLQAIITHSGPNAHQGHFVCETLDESTDTWYMCNDEDVSVIKRDKLTSIPKPRTGYGGEPPSKKARMEENTLNSKDAYMLVYTRMDRVAPIAPPPEIMQLVDAEQAAWDAEQGERYTQKERLEDEYGGLVGAKKQVAMHLAGTEYLVPTAQLERWFAADTIERLFAPWSIPLCPHGDVDPDTTGMYNLVSGDAFDLLQRYGTMRTDPIPTLSEKVNSSANGIAARSKSAASTNSSTLAADDAREMEEHEADRSGHDSRTPGDGRPKKDATPQAGSSRASSSKPIDDNLVGSSSRNRNGNGNDRKSTSPAGPTTFDTLPRLSICPTCVEEEFRFKTTPDISEEDREFWKSEVKQDRLISKMLGAQFVVYGTDYYYLPDSFVDPWLDFMKDQKAPRPQLARDLGRCEHGMLDVDLEMDEIQFISEKGWRLLVEKYGEAEPVTFQFPRVQPKDHGKRSFKSAISTPTCEPCRRRRLSDFEETQVYLKFERTSLPTSRRGTREVPYDVKKSTKILDIKVSVMHQTQIAPIHLKLFHNDRELENEETVESAGILSGDRITCRESEVIALDDEVVIEEERGFGGTALHGRLTCPDCTYENDSAALMCEMCTRPFGYDNDK